VLLDSAGPAEVEARLRLAIGRLAAQRGAVDLGPAEIRSGDVSIDEATYTARVRGRVLDLTYKEFELLKYLAQHPGAVFTRAQLLQEVWGYDYFGGTRTVDVHVRRLRAKLGADHEELIGTVRNVGYRFVPPDRPAKTLPEPAHRR
jgi:DNA-binding response OmpR family regulator